jgi:hypothetical protein
VVLLRAIKNIPVEGPTIKEKANEIVLKLGNFISMFKRLAPGIQTMIEHYMASHEWTGFFCR